MYNFLLIYRKCDNILFMPKILATDIDGTLFYPRALFTILDKKTISFLRRFIDEGNHFCLVSGRNIGIAERISKILDRNVDMIGCNGALIKANGELIKKASFDNKKLLELVDHIYNTYNKGIGGYLLMSDKYNLIFDTHRSKKFTRAFYWTYHLVKGRRADKAILNGDLFQQELETGKVHKIMMFLGIRQKKINLAKEINKELREKYNGEFECSWSDQVIEISPKDSHKASALLEYLNYLKLPKENLYVVGDSGNDISMFNEFNENSFCMEHSHKSVKKYAKHTVNRVSDMEQYLLKKEGE